MLLINERLVDVGLLLDLRGSVFAPGAPVDGFVPQQFQSLTLLDGQLRVLGLDLIDELSRFGLVVGAVKNRHVLKPFLRILAVSASREYVACTAVSFGIEDNERLSPSLGVVQAIGLIALNFGYG